VDEWVKMPFFYGLMILVQLLP